MMSGLEPAASPLRPLDRSAMSSRHQQLTVEAVEVVGAWRIRLVAEEREPIGNVCGKTTEDSPRAPRRLNQLSCYLVGASGTVGISGSVEKWVFGSLCFAC